MIIVGGARVGIDVEEDLVVRSVGKGAELVPKVKECCRGFDFKSVGYDSVFGRTLNLRHSENVDTQ